MEMFSHHNNGGACSPYDGMSPNSNSTDEEGLMLASAYPKKRAGRKKFKETRHPIFRGIRQRNNGKWVCEVREPNKKTRIWLGTFPTADMAARAHDVAAMALRGRSGACLNFADSAWRLPIPASSDTKDIQRAAAEAAELFRPQPPPSEEEETVAEQPETAAGTSNSTNMSFSNNAELYMDYESEMSSPGMIAEMYHGMGMLPPPSDHFTGWTGNYEEEGTDLPLWNFSI
ncbi:hypothetical protein SOVF_153450 [Spinacia oleracea]|uniref:Dehydration-responsive element-binding protein 1E-like n=1 Tax=Spinacia oleracea TaxID=3562 RepID=A0A9R0JPS9_SPIOL|nr:dehydration-responsive element-binding protein 1E-like [Spinacia oleracea]KNA09465.1 hypothetical protein SOVF_153450 [Spinacia oleracea]